MRVEIEKRIPVAAGLGGGSADAAALLRLAGDEVDGLAELAAELGADVPSQLDPAFALVGGAGELVEPLPPPGEFAAVLVPAEEGCAPPTSTPRPTAWASAATARAGRDRRASCATAAAAAPRRWTTPSCWSTTWPRRRSRCGPRSRAALAALEEVGATVALVTGSGPTAFGLFEDIVAADRAADGAAAALCGRDRGRAGPESEPLSATRRAGREDARTFPADRGRPVIVGFIALNRVLPNIDLQQVLEDVSRASATSPTCWSGWQRSWRRGPSSGWCSPGRRW